MSSVHSPSSDKENLELLQGLAEQMLEKGEFLSKPPLFATRSRTDYCLCVPREFSCNRFISEILGTASMNFEFGFPSPQLRTPVRQEAVIKCDLFELSFLNLSFHHCFQVGVMENCPKLYVQRGRRWPLAIGFRPSLTPIDFSIRITPHFVDEDRSNDIIERCSKHAVPSADIKGRSIIEILNPGAIYLTENTLQGIPIGQISVLFPLNVIGLLEQSQERDTPEAIHSSFSQSKLLAAVQCVIHCRINCFNSCLGLNLRGEIDLLITLEARERADPGSPYTVYGTQKVRVRCCACPYRDSRGLCTETELQPNVTASPCTTSNQCASRRRNFRRLSLNLSQRNTSFLVNMRLPILNVF
ncbi:hypothetical protein EG68_06867 [Paragonimus skrjabini miyazakii]|uniref:p53 DNA-binding domain-containing protein n=1 Tax=Paragonimus skrjabini miyazakii TaxID=59628 RepID=A0A8S9YUE6_9TREM|nr:hypothetical protein EG68_06867 [Paragonimus skrjabini miyazakii]